LTRAVLSTHNSYWWRHIHFMTFCFLWHILNCTHIPQMTLSPIHKLPKKIHAILSKCDNVIENIQICMSWQVFFFLGVKICRNMKYIYRKGNFLSHTSDFLKKKSLDFGIFLIIPLRHFSIGFHLVAFFSMFISSWNMSPFNVDNFWIVSN
jgi:hypothetical protein